MLTISQHPTHLVSKSIPHSREAHIREEGEGVEGLVGGHRGTEVQLEVDHVVGQVGEHQREEEKLHKPA